MFIILGAISCPKDKIAFHGYVQLHFFPWLFCQCRYLQNNLLRIRFIYNWNKLKTFNTLYTHVYITHLALLRQERAFCKCIIIRLSKYFKSLLLVLVVYREENEQSCLYVQHVTLGNSCIHNILFQVQQLSLNALLKYFTPNLKFRQYRTQNAGGGLEKSLSRNISNRVRDIDGTRIYKTDVFDSEGLVIVETFSIN